MRSHRSPLAGNAANSTFASTLRVLTVGTAFVAGVWLLYYALSTLRDPFPIEYREAAAQVVTQLLLAGRNPFSIESQPLGMTNYGVLFSLAAWPLARLFGNTLLIHRAVALAFVVLSAYVVARTAYSSSRQLALSVAGAELVAAALAARGGLGGYPSSMGAFLFLVAISAPYLRGFDRWGLLISGAASLLAFYTKPYFVLGWGIVATYTFLWVSKKKGLAYGVGFGAVFGISALLVRTIMPMYFFDTVFSNLAHTAEPALAHLYLQLRQLLVEFFPLIGAGLLMLAVGLPRPRHDRGAGTGSFLWRSLLVADRPVLSPPISFFAWASACAALAFVLILGPHPENYMNYAYQLLVPAFLLWLFERLPRQGAHALWMNGLLLANLVLFCLTRLPAGHLQQSIQSRRAWETLYEYADSCQHPLNSPTIVPVLLKRGLWPVDSGHTEYFFSAQPYPGMGLLGTPYEVIASMGTEFIRSLRSSVAHHEFDCVILARHSAWPSDLPLERGGYWLADSVIIAMPQVPQSWQMDIWVPKPEPGQIN